MTAACVYDIPRLATVSLNPTPEPGRPVLEIRLDAAYTGDLRNVARRTAGPQEVYLQCTDTSALNSPELARFMEVLSHWDHDRDGTFDHHDLVAAIDNALWRADDTPREFRRPTGSSFERLVMAIMPPPPNHHIVFSFGNLKPLYKWHHYAGGLIVLAFVLITINLQIHFMPVMKYSVITGVIAIFEFSPILGGVTLGFFYAMMRKSRKQAGRQSISPHTYGILNKAAVFEEQAFREGAENWTAWQRTRSCLAFGAIHLANLIYPLATILPLAAGGAFFMWMYLRTHRRVAFRRTAVLEAAVWHRVYNRMALAAIVLVLLAVFGWAVFGALATAGALTLLAKALRNRRLKQRRNHTGLIAEPTA